MVTSCLNRAIAVQDQLGNIWHDSKKEASDARRIEAKAVIAELVKHTQ